MQLTSKHWIIFSIQVTEVLGFSLILPFLQLYAQSFGASTLLVGVLGAVFSLCQFISAPIMGRLSDKYGRRPLLLISQLSTMIGFALLAVAPNFWWLLVARVIDGAFGSNFTIAQAYLSDITPPDERKKVFGLTGIAFGVGFLIGPGIGGLLSTISYSLPSILAAAFSGLTIVLTYFLLPETIKKDQVQIKQSLSSHFTQTFSGIQSYLTKAHTSSPLLVLFCATMAHALFVSSFALFASLHRGYTSQEIGFLLMYFGGITIVMRGYLINTLIDMLGESRLVKLSFVLKFCGLIMAAWAPNTLLFILAGSLFAFGTGAIGQLLLSAIANSVPNQEQGSIMGVNSSLGSITQIIAPLLAGVLLQYGPSASLPLASAAVLVFSAIWLRDVEYNSQKKRSSQAW